jgi:hypothetical protein
MDLGEEISGLYAGPFDAFTSARDALAKRLRQDGDREAADHVKKLRKPNITAWALNRVRAANGPQVRALLDAGDQLRDAQEALFGSGTGSGSQEALRAAAAEQRRLIDTLVAAGLEQLTAAGHPSTPALQTRLFSTLRAVASDDEARAALAAGTLTRDYEIADFGFGLAPAVAPPDAAPKRKRAPASKTERHVEPDERAVQAARDALTAAQSELEQADADAAAARETLLSATGRLSAAREALAAAREAFASAEEAAASAEDVAATAQDALTAATAAQELARERVAEHSAQLERLET